MQVTTTNTVVSSFEPIELTIKIESLAELKMLWSQFNINMNNLQKYGEEVKFSKNEADSVRDAKTTLWNNVNVIMKEHM